PASKAGRTIFHQLAKYSWISILCSIAAKKLLTQLFITSPATANRAVVISVSFWVFTGIAAGIIALFGIRRHGRKGILIPALVGSVIRVGPIFLTIFFGLGLPPGSIKRGASPIRFAPLQTDSTAQRISSQDPPFSLDIPKGFEAIPPDERPPDTRFAFMRS